MSEHPPRLSLRALGADDAAQGGGAAGQGDVYNMSDRDLARGCARLLAHPVEAAPLNARETAFCTDLPKSFARSNRITWKQRREARRVLIKRLAQLLRLKDVLES